MSHNEIDVQDLLARDVVVAWFESVALVQSVCRGLISGGEGGAFPAGSSILLRSDGSTVVSGPFSDGPAVESAARLLAEMNSSDLPVQLRLVITQAAASGSPYSGLEDFSRALAYYERSEPQQILQGLYARAAAAPRRSGDAPKTLAPSGPPQESAAPKRPNQKKRSQMPLVAGLATVVGLSVAGWASGGLPAVGQPLTQGMTLFENTVRAKLGAAPVDAAAPTPDAAAPLERQPATGRSSARVTGRMSTPSPRVGEPASRAVAPAANRAPEPLAALDTSSLSAAIAAVSGVAPRFYSTVDIVANAAPTTYPEGGRVYSWRDEGVVPPRAVYPQLPTAPHGAPADGQTIVDLVIAPTGHVEGARLRTPPRNIHEFMLLSAAKAWRFDPAVHEDGHPVRFRHSVVITAYP
jgi:hypothetical protein